MASLIHNVLESGAGSPPSKHFLIQPCWSRMTIKQRCFTCFLLDFFPRSFPQTRCQSDTGTVSEWEHLFGRDSTSLRHRVTVLRMRNRFSWTCGRFATDTGSVSGPGEHLVSRGGGIFISQSVQTETPLSLLRKDECVKMLSAPVWYLQRRVIIKGWKRQEEGLKMFFSFCVWHFWVKLWIFRAEPD